MILEKLCSYWKHTVQFFEDTDITYMHHNGSLLHTIQYEYYVAQASAITVSIKVYP